MIDGWGVVVVVVVVVAAVVVLSRRIAIWAQDACRTCIMYERRAPVLLRWSHHSISDLPPCAVFEQLNSLQKIQQSETIRRNCHDPSQQLKYFYYPIDDSISFTLLSTSPSSLS